MADGGHSCVLSIDDHTSEVTEWTASASPFVTDVDDAEDIFTPVRAQSGYIRILGEVGDLDGVVNSAPKNRPVTLEVDGAVAWKGFLSCETFTQPWDKGPIEMELPVVSPLGILDGLKPSSSLADMGYLSFARFILNMEAEMGNPHQRFVFPTLTEPELTLTLNFCMMNYATPNDDDTGRTMASYREILEDVCKFFGWQCMERGDELIFLCADTRKLMISGKTLYNAIAYTKERLQALADGIYDGGDIVEYHVEDVEIAGAEHDLTYMAGKSSVKVIGKLNERSESVWSMDIENDCEFDGGDSLQIELQKWYYMRNYSAKGSIDVFNDMGNKGNIKFRNAQEARLATMEGDSKHQGGCVTNECTFTVSASGGFVETSGDKSFVPRLIIRNADATKDHLLCARINTGFWYSPTRMASDEARFILTGNVEVANSHYDIFAPYTGFIFIALKVGNMYYDATTGGFRESTNAEAVYVRNGVITKNNASLSNGYGVDGWYFHTPSFSSKLEGEVVLEIYAPSPSSESDFTFGTKYIAFTQLSLQLMRNWRVAGFDEERKKQNENRRNIDGGFSDGWVQECGLTLARASNLPDSLGVALDRTLDYPEMLYGDMYPEEALMERAYTYFSQSRLRLGVIVEGNCSMLDPLKVYRLGGRGYVCLSQQVNWKTDEVKGKFYETIYSV